MAYRFNNHFSYNTFEEEAVALNKPVRCLTFQGVDAYEEIMSKGIYRPDINKSRGENKGWYKSVVEKYGFMPVWVINPLQFGEEVQTTWNADWFIDGSLWRRFLETCGMSEEIINNRLLLEIEIPSVELHKDVTLDYGFVSVVKEIHKESIVAIYRLQYVDLEQDTADDWFYPIIYPSRSNDDRAAFKEVTDFRDPSDRLDIFVNELLDSIPEERLKTGFTDLYNRVCAVLSNLKARKNKRERDCSDDVRYAIYNHESEGWIPVCVQDFDFKDYDKHRFLLDMYPCGSVESDAIAVFRQPIHSFFAVDLKSADAIAAVVAEEICKSL